jgi:DNA-binding MarR family transcriptional regulator
MNERAAGAEGRTRARAGPPAHSPAGIDALLRELQGQCVCGNLRTVTRLVTALYDAALRPCGIEANQMHMLWVLRVEGAMPANRLARSIGMDPSTASRNVAVLEQRRLVSTSPDVEDRRRRRVGLTRSGRAALYRAFPCWQDAQQRLCALTGDVTDIVATGRLLRKVARRMQAARMRDDGLVRRA